MNQKILRSYSGAEQLCHQIRVRKENSTGTVRNSPILSKRAFNSNVWYAARGSSWFALRKNSNNRITFPMQKHEKRSKTILKKDIKVPIIIITICEGIL